MLRFVFCHSDSMAVGSGRRGSRMGNIISGMLLAVLKWSRDVSDIKGDGLQSFHTALRVFFRLSLCPSYAACLYHHHHYYKPASERRRRDHISAIHVICGGRFVTVQRNGTLKFSDAIKWNWYAVCD